MQDVVVIIIVTTRELEIGNEALCSRIPLAFNPRRANFD